MSRPDGEEPRAGRPENHPGHELGDDLGYDDPDYADDPGGDDFADDYYVHRVATEAASSVVARRRRKALITLAVLLLGLFFAFWWAYSYYKASDGGASRAGTSASAAPTCQPVDPNALTPAKITLNVYNATKRAGLAGTVSKEFAAQGYVLGKVANDPAKHAIAGPAEVRFGPAGKAAGELVMKSIGQGAVPVEDTRADATVDVALGDGFSALQPLPSDSASPALPPCEPSAAASPSPSSS